MQARNMIEGKSSFILARFFFVMKKGVKINEAIKSLEKTNVIGPTSGAEILMKRKEDPHAIPIAMIRDQSRTEFFCICCFVICLPSYSSKVDLQ